MPVPTFDTVLVANRGEIAVRIIRTLRDLGIRSVAVHSTADRSARHVLDADEAVPIGDPPPGESYLRIDRILEAALSTGAQAVHPGYGLLSESAAFAEACEVAGVTFVGPTPEQLRLFGLKHTARALACGAGVAVTAASTLLTDADDAIRAARDVRLPVVLKATAGGGGIGMRVCRTEADLIEAFDTLARLAVTNFGDGGLYVERFVPRARHVEVQALGDGWGRVITFPTRDCSLQRRHQKVVEETPAPNLPPGSEEALAAAAERLLASVAYRSAGTVEFLVDEDTGEHAFLEVNTRLQVEHGVTELVTGVDLVAEMLAVAGGSRLEHLPDRVPARGHAFEARVYAEDPVEAFRPSTGLVTRVQLPAGPDVRVDGWVEAGTEVGPFYDPLLAKLLVRGDDRAQALDRLAAAVDGSRLDGIETNCRWLADVVSAPSLVAGRPTTAALGEVAHESRAMVVVDPGPATSVQDLPGRLGYWAVGVPPSGPMDEWSFRLANRAAGNPEQEPALEMTQRGAVLRFRAATTIALAGASMAADIDGRPVPWFEPVDVDAGAVLRLGEVTGPGCRAYLAVAGGIDVPEHLGSRSTFALGGLGGHGGRTLRAGDVLHIGPARGGGLQVPLRERPVLATAWTLRVLSGPHGAPDFLTADGIEALAGATWEVHFHSDRTGVRLVGPTPGWARPDGGEAGLHPSNLHDTPYAVGTIDLTGDMPIVLGPDGPSCGGFVCPFTVTIEDRWKLGQLRAGDTVRFEVVADGIRRPVRRRRRVPDPVLVVDTTRPDRPELAIRRAGDRALLVEFGPHELDLGLRLRIGVLMEHLGAHPLPGVGELTPGVRSLQVAYDPDVVAESAVVAAVVEAEAALPADDDLEVASRIVHLPLSWDDPTAREAAERYARVVRPDAPWCPWNLEFIRRINGLDSVDDVRRTVLDASYLVLALGDVYLGAPVATPVDPRHRLVTTKYNPARTWTAENAVGIGGAYLCVYGTEGPGGYQLIGRTVQMWNRWRRTADFTEPWLLRPFDQLRFHPVSGEELLELRADLPAGRAQVAVEAARFRLADHRAFVRREADAIGAFRARREAAFLAERARWEAAGLDVASTVIDTVVEDDTGASLADGQVPVPAPMAGMVSRVVETGTRVRIGDPVVWLEAMKSETALTAAADGVVVEVRARPGAVVRPGAVLAVIGP